MIPKFRIFIKDTQFMDYDVVGIDFKREHAIVDTGWDIEEIRRFKDIVLMQSTGIHDKNGKEIFEGDILRVIQKGTICEYTPHHEILAVKYDKLCTGFVFDTLGGQVIGLYLTGDELEILGNIHQHPHLLKEDE